MSAILDEKYNPFSLHGKNILITGASSGIGRQCAVDCSMMGATVILLGRNLERLKETYKFLKGSGHYIICEDLSNNDAITNLLKEALSKVGSVDGFIHAAGIEKTQLLKNLKPDDYVEVFKTNFVGAMNLLKTLTIKGNFNYGFKIVLIASITAMIARVGTLAYTASKGALVAAVRELSIELAPKGINVNCISPGTILTPMMENVLSKMNEDQKSNRLKGFALGIGYPEDISNACIFLLSDGARWITGQNIVVDGGFTAQ